MQTTFYLVDTGRGMPRWCQLMKDSEDNSIWVDFKGRKVAYADGRPLAHVEGGNVHATISQVPEAVAELERGLAFRHLLDPWSDQGWISPDGKFWGCSFYAHDDIAYALIRKSPAQLEHLGWVRVHADSFRTGDDYRRITKRQQDTLSALGFVDVEPGGMRGRSFTEDRSTPPPRYAIKPPADTIEAKIDAARKMEPLPTVDSALHGFVARLAGCEALEPLFRESPEFIPEVGPGTWMWMLRWDHMDIGGEEHPGDLVASPGIHLRATSSNTLEASAWPFDEIRIDPEALRIVQPAGRTFS